MLSLLRAAGLLLAAGLVLLLSLGVRPRRLGPGTGTGTGTGAEAGAGGGTVLVTGTAIAAWAGHDWLRAEADRTFDTVGLATTLAGIAVLVGVLAAIRSPRRAFDLFTVIGHVAAVAAWLAVIAVAVNLAWDPALERLAVPRSWQPTLWQVAQAAAAAWVLLVMWQLGRTATADSAKRIGGWLVLGCLAGGLLLPSRPMFDGAAAEPGVPGLLHLAGQYVGTALAKKPTGQPPPRPPRIDVEATYYAQPALVGRALAGLAPSRPDRPEIYFLAAATFAGQAVFMREVMSARRIVDERLGTAERSLLLINHRETLATVPLGNVTNLEAALAALGRIMDPDKDLLFLYITSHGSPGEIAVQFQGFAPTPLTPERLAGMLAASGIKHRLVVISACYSGSFIPALQGPDTVILTAARPDRTSFGCSDERDWTYFGDALFNHALRQTHSITDAFERAKKLVAQWEAEQKVDPSEPQISAGAAALAKLDEIAARLGALAGEQRQ